MHLGSFAIEGTVVCLPHAMNQARERDPRCKGKTAEEVRAWTEERVAEMIGKGNVHDRKTKGFGMYGRSTVPPWQRFVLDSGRGLAWIVSLDHPPDVHVITVLKQLAL